MNPPPSASYRFRAKLYLWLLVVFVPFAGVYALMQHVVGVQAEGASAMRAAFLLQIEIERFAQRAAGDGALAATSPRSAPARDDHATGVAQRVEDLCTALLHGGQAPDAQHEPVPVPALSGVASRDMLMQVAQDWQNLWCAAAVADGSPAPAPCTGARAMPVRDAAEHARESAAALQALVMAECLEGQERARLLMLGSLVIGGALVIGLAAYLQLRVLTPMASSAQVIADSEARLRKAVDLSPFPIMIHAEDGTIIQLSRSWLELTGYDREALTTVEQWNRLGRRLMDGGHEVLGDTPGPVATQVWTVYTRDGAERFWSVSSSSLGPLADGRQATITIAADVTERQATARVLQESRERFELAVLGSSDGLWDWDLVAGTIWYAPRFAQLLGHEPGELQPVYDEWAERIHPHDRDRAQAALRDHLEHGRPYDVDIRMRLSNGYYRWFRARGVATRDEHWKPTRMAGSIQDITDRKQAEEQLRLESAALESAANAIVITDRNGLITWLNPAFERLTGYSRDEVIGRNLSFLDSGLYPEKFYTDIWNTITSGRVWHGRITNRRKDGSLYTEDTTITPVFNEHETLTHFVSIKNDISHELQLEHQLRQAQKLESIGQLAAGIAHEINTPTQFVGDNTRFLKDAYADLKSVLDAFHELLSACAEGGAVQEKIQQVKEAVQAADLEYLLDEIPKATDQSLEGIDRVSRIVRAMKDFSHPGQQGRTAADLNRSLESTITVARNEWKYVADLVTDFDANLPRVPCYVNDLNQVFLNIIINAAHAIADAVGDGSDGKGTITVTTRQVQGWAEVRIADTGTGIKPEHRSRIFDPFFTTKQVGRGTGQGLALAYATVVEKHGGVIDFETEVGKGTTFFVRLPLEPAAEVPVSPESSLPTAAANTV